MTRQYDVLRSNMGQKEPSRLGSTICYGQELARRFKTMQYAAKQSNYSADIQLCTSLI